MYQPRGLCGSSHRTGGLDRHMFRNFKKEKGKGKRDDYFKNDGIYSGYKLKPEHQPIVTASPRDEKKHVLGEIMCGGAGSSGLMTVMFILFQKEVFCVDLTDPDRKFSQASHSRHTSTRSSTRRWPEQQ